jgi:hypothetical protein
MKLIKKLARKLLFTRKKKISTPTFQAKPTTSANSVVEPVITFEKPKLGGHDLDDKKASDPKKKKPGRPKNASGANPQKTPAKKVTNTPKTAKKA